MKIFATRSLNLEALFRTIILTGFSAFFALTIKTGEALIYVNPKMLPFIKFGAAAMGIMAVISAKDVFKIPRNKARLTTYMLFALPLALALIFPPASIGSGDLKGRQMEMGLPQERPAETELEPNQKQEQVGPGGSEPEHDAPADLKDGISPVPDLEEEIIVVKDYNYINWLYILYRDADAYQGTEIEITGFVFKDADFEENQFVVSRFVMVCCIADMQLAGLLCRYEGAQELEVDSWVHIRGTLERDTFMGESLPAIIPREIIPVEKPQIPYIYP